MPKVWNEARLMKLIENEIEESLTLEYKSAEALDRTDFKKKEITKDVSAMANSAGGTIIYGIFEYAQPEKRNASRRSSGRNFRANGSSRSYRRSVRGSKALSFIR
jgi:predicted HTH transcriptional regulator